MSILVISFILSFLIERKLKVDPIHNLVLLYIKMNGGFYVDVSHTPTIGRTYQAHLRLRQL